MFAHAVDNTISEYWPIRRNLRPVNPRERVENCVVGNSRTDNRFVAESCTECAQYVGMRGVWACMWRDFIDARVWILFRRAAGDGVRRKPLPLCETSKLRSAG
jgi:hypothetical protein